MDTGSPVEHAYVTKRLTILERAHRSAPTAFGALLSALFAGAILTKEKVEADDQLFFWFLFMTLFWSVWITVKKWKTIDVTELATVKIPPTKTERFLGYTVCSITFLLGILCAYIGGIDGWGYAGLFWLLTGLLVYQLLIPKNVLTLAARAEKDRIEKVKLQPPSSSSQSDSDFYIVISYLVGFVVFISSWIYCIATYGYLLGVGLGWLPSIIVAFIAGLLWPLILLIILIGGFIIYKSSNP